MAVCPSLLLLAGPGLAPSQAQPFLLPTGNQALFEQDGQDRYFVGTVGRTWVSGTFGCVRSEGYQFHEGLDIQCVQRDSRGEPVDPILASASGQVAYINRRPGYSTFGNYIILKHTIEGLPIYSLYAHLSEVRPDLKPGDAVRSLETIGVMGRTASTRDGISKERAHLHFEIGLLLNDQFSAWHQKRYPKNRNDHGDWNGQSMIGLDPWHVLVAPYQHFGPFSLTVLIRNQTELCRVIVRDTQFSWLDRYAPLIKPNPATAREPVAGYEIALNYVGMPFELIPRTAREIPDKNPVQLVSVNEVEQQERPCSKLVLKKGGQWELSSKALTLLDLLTH